MSQEFTGPTLEESLYALLLTKEYYWEKVPILGQLAEIGTDKAYEMMEQYLYRELPYGGYYQGCDYGATCQCVRDLASISDPKTPEAIEKAKRYLLPALINGNRAARKYCVHELSTARFCTPDTLEKANELLAQSEAAQDDEMVNEAKFLIGCIEDVMAGKTYDDYFRELQEAGFKVEFNGKL